jgi:hypothetical protein
MAHKVLTSTGHGTSKNREKKTQMVHRKGFACAQVSVGILREKSRAVLAGSLA